MARKALFLESTDIPAERSAGEISTELVSAGARRISTQHDDQGKIVGIDWTLRVGALDQFFAMPARVEPVFEYLKQRAGTNRIDAAKTRLKAERIAWRQLLLWVKAQNAMIETGMVKAEEVFMPYALGNDGRTAFEVWSSQLSIAAPQGAK
jgi:hypothetical protein